MNDIQFLLDLATRLDALQREAPNISLHWLDAARLRLVAAELEAKGVRLEGMQAAIEGLMTRQAPVPAAAGSMATSLLRPATAAPMQQGQSRPLPHRDNFMPRSFA